MSAANKQFLRAPDIAELTGLSVRTVRRWIASATLPSTKLGGARLVATADFEAVLSASRLGFQESYNNDE
jgi:excisionase family DNA binding protein